MSIEDSRSVMGIGALVCALGVLLNVFMLRKRGLSAAIMAGAFLCLGVALLLIFAKAPAWSAGLFGMLVFGLLALDFILRIRKLGGPG
jgi:hypothetical protein